jgi:hypothetical protein
MRRIIDSTGITILGDDADIIMVSAGDPTYGTIRDYLLSGGADMSRIRELAVDGKAEVRAVVTGVRDAVDGGDATYRITHGDPVDEVVLAAAVRVRRDTGNLAAFGAFTRRLEANPSPASRSQLFAWLAAGGFTITPDGLIVGYKGVGVDGRSIASGRERVTVTHQDGTVESVIGKVPYPVGATVEMERREVDDNRDSACSVGLHVGQHAYASSFGAKVILVLVDPADVVSVPRDHYGQKMRVCKLTVAAEHGDTKISDAVFDHVQTAPDAEAEGAYRARPENQPPTCDEYDDDEEDEDVCADCGDPYTATLDHETVCAPCGDRRDYTN